MKCYWFLIPQSSWTCTIIVFVRFNRQRLKGVMEEVGRDLYAKDDVLELPFERTIFWVLNGYVRTLRAQLGRVSKNL